MTSTRVEVVELTPELAAEYLELNTHNRNIRANKVEEFAGAMTRGEWKYNGDTIVWNLDADDEWFLVDGQHRLEAVMQAGYTLSRQIVVWGVEEGAQVTIDDGTKRTMADRLRLQGEVDTANLASSVRLLHRYLHSQDLRSQRVAETPQQLLATLQDHPGLRDAVRAAHRKDSMVPFVPRSVAAIMYYLMGGIDELDRDEFLQQVALGENLSATDPAMVLRKRLTANKVTTHKRLRTEELAALIIKAWNKWRAGEDASMLSWKARVEDYPLLDGFHEAWSDSGEQLAAA